MVWKLSTSLTKGEVSRKAAVLEKAAQLMSSLTGGGINCDCTEGKQQSTEVEGVGQHSQNFAVKVLFLDLNGP